MSDTGQSPNAEGSDLRTIANQIEGLLDDSGHYNPNPEQVSRGHPDYDESADPRAEAPQRDERGRFVKQQAETEAAGDADTEQLPEGDDQTEDTYEASDTDGDQTASADETPEQSDEDTGTIQTLAELAEALEMPLEELAGQITHSFRAADEDVTVTLAELTSGYQKDADYRRGTGKLSEDRRKLELETQQRMQMFEQANMVMAQQLNAVEALFSNQLNDPQLAELRQTNPAEWTARREEIGQQLAYIQQVKQQAAQNYDKQRYDQLSAMRSREQTALTDRMPDFGEPQRLAARGAMESLGFAPEEIGGMLDHRLVLGALELANLRAEVQTLRDEKAKAKDTVKRVKKEIPKITKPGKQRLQTRQGIQRDRVQQLKKRAKSSGSVEDAAAVIETMI